MMQGHVNHAAERAFWKGPERTSQSNAPEVNHAAVGAGRSDHGETPSCDPAGSGKWPFMEGEV